MKLQKILILLGGREHKDVSVCVGRGRVPSAAVFGAGKRRVVFGDVLPQVDQSHDRACVCWPSERCPLSRCRVCCIFSVVCCQVVEHCIYRGGDSRGIDRCPPPPRPACSGTRGLLVTVKGQAADMVALSDGADGGTLFRRLSCSVTTALSSWLRSSAPS